MDVPEVVLAQPGMIDKIRRSGRLAGRPTLAPTREELLAIVAVERRGRMKIDSSV